MNQPPIVFDPEEIYKIEEKIEETKKIQEETTKELTKIAGGPKRDESFPTFVSPLIEYIKNEDKKQDGNEKDSSSSGLDWEIDVGDFD